MSDDYCLRKDRLPIGYEITERGSHDELMTQKGLYYKLYMGMAGLSNQEEIQENIWL